MKKGTGIKTVGKLFYIISSFVILSLISVSVYAALPTATAPNPGHSGNQVFIKYGNYYVTFETAFNRSYLTELHANVAANLSSANSDSFPLTTPYHLASQILVQVKSASNVLYTMTLQEAVDHDVFVNGPTQSYTTQLPVGGQMGSDINVTLSSSITKTIQDAITQGTLSPSSLAAPVPTIDCYYITTSSGISPLLQNSCTYCDGSYVSRGTVCYKTPYDTTKLCDGSGGCSLCIQTYSCNCNSFGGACSTCTKTVSC